MSDTASPTAPRSAPAWFLAAAALGLAWNIFGIYQFLGTFRASPESLIAGGMTPDQAAVYLALPAWVSIAFAIGVFAATAGCALLLLRRDAAVPVLAASLAGYAVLFAADVGYGVFASIPAQLVILAFVVAVAVALLALAIVARRRGLLR